MTTTRGDDTSGADRSRVGGIAHLDARRVARDEHALELVVVRIHEELERQGVSALKLPIAPLVSGAGSLVRLRKAARRAGALYGWTKTRTTKVIDDDDVEWLVMYDYGRDLRLVGGMDPRLRRVVEMLSVPGDFGR